MQPILKIANIFKNTTLIIGVLTIAIPMPTLALSNRPGSDPSGKSQRYIIEKTPWYDPTACPGGGGSSVSVNNPSLQGKVYVIGDSITANKQFVQDSLISRLKARGFSDVVINSLSSRSLSDGKTDLNGISVFEKDPAWNDANTIIIELGTNGGISTDNISKIMDLIKQKNPKANVFWVNVGVDNSKRKAQGNSEINVDQIDQTLQDNSNLGYTVIDWKTIAKNNPNYILDDDVDVHPFTTDGGSAYVNTIVSAISKSTTNTNRIGGSCECSVGAGESAINLVGNNNEEKVWNFLISAGFTKEQAAGVIGNMYAESGVNPRRMQGTKTPEGDSDYPLPDKPGKGPEDITGYGTVQWTPGYKISSYAQQKNKIPGDLGFQLGLLVAQLNGTDNTGIPEKSAGEDLKKQTTPEAAARSFMLKYERPLDQSEEKQAGRAEKAREVFDRLSGGAAFATNNEDCQEADSSNIGDKIAAIAEEQFASGASESNGGYLKYTGDVVSPGGWCDYFVSWIYREAGIPFTGGSGAKGYAMIPVPSMQAYFLNKNAFHPARSGYVPKPGDVVIWDYQQDGVLNHVSIVVSVDGQKMTTVGGNESDKVSKRVYASFDNKDVYGFGSPVK